MIWTQSSPPGSRCPRSLVFDVERLRESEDMIWLHLSRRYSFPNLVRRLNPTIRVSYKKNFPDGEVPLWTAIEVALSQPMHLLCYPG